MKLKVIQRFSDKLTRELHLAGSVIERDEKRAKDLIGRNLCEEIKESIKEINTEAEVVEAPKEAKPKKTRKKKA